MSEPPKKASGSRPLVIGVVVALAAIGGVVAFMSLGPTASAPPPTSVAPKPVAAPPAFEPPPPPPVDEAPPSPELVAEVKPEAVKPGPRRPTGCEADCIGTATAELQSALRAKAGQARSCYERALTHNSSLQGTALINVRVGPNGDACSAAIGAETLGDPSVTNCVVQRFRSGKFPKPTGGCVDVAVPISFVPAQR